jgi:quinoprotein glucose dehydrogenase
MNSGRPISSFGRDGASTCEGLGKPAERLSVCASTPGSIFEDLIIRGSSVPETLPGSPGHIRGTPVCQLERDAVDHPTVHAAQRAGQRGDA